LKASTVWQGTLVKETNNQKNQPTPNNQKPQTYNGDNRLERVMKILCLACMNPQYELPWEFKVVFLLL